MQLVKFIICFGILSLAACEAGKGQSAKATLVAEIKNLQEQLTKAEDVQKDREAAAQFVEKCMIYVQDYPEDTLSPVYLFQAADVSRGLGNFGKSIQLWGQVWRNYEQYDKAGDALFLQGFVYDNDFQDSVNAQRYYSKFIQKYPNHPYVAQAQQLLSVLGKSSEDLIREFEEKRQE